jgi:acetylornithine deacetylase/succinyl-diaminopimelate desuccinylase-like protein
MEKIHEYISEHKEKFLDELLSLLRIPSVSADPLYKDSMMQTAEFLKEKMQEIGIDHVKVVETRGHPIVYGEKIISDDKPTVLVYGHYDVQPPDPLDLWNSPPFDPVIQDGKIYARGSCDDKGQLYMHLKSMEALLRNGALSCNVKFMFEGEEEIGSVNLEQFLRENQEKLACDVILISDTSIIDNDVPSITVGLRGLSYLEVEVEGPNRDLHSGVYGGGVANPINILCNMISSLHDDKGRVTIPGFYEDVVEISEAERRAMNKAPFNLPGYMQELGISNIHGENGFTTIERTSIRPTLDVNGIWGGYIGDGAKTVLPSKAFAKISMRLVPDQDSDKISRMFATYFKSLAPDSVKVKVCPHHGGSPAVTPVDTDEYKAASKAMEKTFGKIPIPTRSGGSIPIVALFEEVLGVKTVLLGFGLDSDNIHSPNEHYGLFNYFKGIETIPYFYHYYAELKSNNNADT